MNYLKTRFCITAIIGVLAFCLTTRLNAQLQPARIFNNGMVLQRDIEIPVWGTAAANDTVIVALETESDTIIDTAFADATGKWEAILAALDAGGPYIVTIDNEDILITLINVYVGDVWLASGQSNMAFKLSQSNGGAAAVASANNQTIREFTVQNVLGSSPASDVPSGSTWYPATSSYAGNFSAVGYYFAANLQDDISVPIGIINSSQGGARIETFMSEEMLGFDETDVTLANGETERQPTMAFNTMIYPLIRYPIKGIIWYQGESNCDNMTDAVSYGNIFKRMIIAWRNLWGLGDIPFLWVQLPNQGTAAVESEPNVFDAWPILRAAQSRALSLPNTGEAATIDIGAVDIHPTNKQPVGERLSLVARKVVYGEDIVYSGPRYKNHTLLTDGRVKIRFDHVGTGLIAKNAVNDSLHWFSLAGSNNTLVSAKAVLDGDSVLVWSDQVPEPVILRYAWEYNPENINLFNVEDLPAVPFLIEVVDPGFVIDTFYTTQIEIERGKSTVLTWKAYGASSITLNNEPVDSIDGIMVYPNDTTVYTLKAVNSLDANDVDSLSITINVIEPRPTIYVTTDLGDLIAPDTEITLIANVTTPVGGTITNVEFYINDVLLITDNEAPYETTWTPPTLGEFSITAIVTDGNDVSVESTAYNLYVSNFTTIKYEAESATRSGNGSVKNNSSVSGGKYVDLTDGWVLTFSGINMPETKEYQLSIRYMLNYESPKTQTLIINGVTYTDIQFTAPNATTWTTYRMNVPLITGSNVIAIDGSWDWMSFDYIAVSGEGLVSNLNDIQNTEFSLSQISPNPFSSFTNISFAIPATGNVLLEVYDCSGRQVAVLINENRSGGNYTYNFNPGELESGIYFARLTYNLIPQTKQMLLIR